MKENSTMKRTTILGLILVLAAALAACAPAASIKAGSASAEALVKLMPESTRGVVAIDVHRAMELASVAKMIEANPAAKAKYDEIVKLAGLDPAKDVYLFVLGLMGVPGEGEPDGGFIVNLRYNKDAILAAMKQKAPDYKEEAYNGVTVYSNLDGDDKQATRAAFLDDSNIVLGSSKGVKGIIDVFQKKAGSVMKNPEMAAIIKKVDKEGLGWVAFSIPPELIAKGIAAQPQLKVLEGLKALTMSYDHRLAKYVADIRTMGGTEDQNKNLSQALTGLKSLGAMLGGQEPAVGELMNSIEITSGKDFVRLYISVTDELAEKLGKLAQAKAGEFIKINKGPTGEEKD
jgi:hypothetical protein